MGLELLYHYQDDGMTNAIATMDLQLLCGGHADAKDDLEQFHPFRSDPFFRVYRPISGKLRVMDCDNTTQITTDCYWIFPSEMPFRMLSDGGFTHDWFHFRSSALEQRRLNTILCTQKTPELDAIWERFLNEEAAPERSFNNVYQSHLLARAIIAPFLEQLENRQHISDNSDAKRYNSILEYIEKNYMLPVQTSELAEMMKLNQNQFSASFRRHFGITPKAHIINTRIHHAKILLLTSAQTVAEVAQRCGFSDAYYFHRLFKNRLGMTPCQYRETMYLGK